MLEHIDTQKHKKELLDNLVELFDKDGNVTDVRKREIFSKVERQFKSESVTNRNLIQAYSTLILNNSSVVSDLFDLKEELAGLNDCFNEKYEDLELLDAL